MNNNSFFYSRSVRSGTTLLRDLLKRVQIFCPEETHFLDGLNPLNQLIIIMSIRRLKRLLCIVKWMG